MVNCYFSIVPLHLGMQRIYNCGEIQNIILTPDKVLNVLIYGSLHFSKIWLSLKTGKWS